MFIRKKNSSRLDEEEEEEEGKKKNSLLVLHLLFPVIDERCKEGNCSFPLHNSCETRCQYGRKNKDIFFFFSSFMYTHKHQTVFFFFCFCSIKKDTN
jgi:hypothetical protein